MESQPLSCSPPLLALALYSALYHAHFVVVASGCLQGSVRLLPLSALSAAACKGPADASNLAFVDLKLSHGAGPQVMILVLTLRDLSAGFSGRELKDGHDCQHLSGTSQLC